MAIAVDRYFCICHPLRHVTVATARRARVVVVVLAVVTVVLGLLGAASFSIYHSVSISVERPNVPVAVTSASAADGEVPLGDWRPYNLTRMISFTDSEHAAVVSSACAKTSNETNCSTWYELANTGYCGESHLILSPALLRGYNVIHSLIYPFCLLAVLVLYGLIYRSVLIQRARRESMRSPAIALASPPTAPSPTNKATGISLRCYYYVGFEFLLC